MAASVAPSACVSGSRRSRHGRRGDAQPGDAERADVGEQQHGERRAEVVQHGARDEVGGGRRLTHAFILVRPSRSGHGTFKVAAATCRYFDGIV
jgi:hypothetical protein